MVIHLRPPIKMSTRMKKYKKELCFLGTCKRGQRATYLKQAPAGLIHAVGDVAKTLLKGNLPLTEAQRRKLRKQRGNLITLATRGGSVQNKRKILSSPTRRFASRDHLAGN